MSAIFLSASVPTKGRKGFDTADPFLIREAVSAFVEVALGRRMIVWGGHPAITPIIWAAAEAFGLDYGSNVRLFQTQFFEDRYPEDNKRFENVTYVPASNSLTESLSLMRDRMLRSYEFEAAVFVGGMEGIQEEYQLFREIWPKEKIVALPAPGGAARDIFHAEELPPHMENALDFSSWLYDLLDISPSEKRR